MRKVFLSLIIFFGLALVASPTLVIAQNPAPAAADCNSADGFVKIGDLCVLKSQAGGSGLATKTTAQDLIVSAVRILLYLAGALSVLFIIIGGFQYMSAGASESLAKKGKATLTYAIIGLVVTILAYVIAASISNLLS